MEVLFFSLISASYVTYLRSLKDTRKRRGKVDHNTVCRRQGRVREVIKPLLQFYPYSVSLGFVVTERFLNRMQVHVPAFLKRLHLDNLSLHPRRLGAMFVFKTIKDVPLELAGFIQHHHLQYHINVILKIQDQTRFTHTVYFCSHSQGCH